MRTEFCLQIDGHTNRVTPIYPLNFVGGGIPTDQSNKTIKYMYSIIYTAFGQNFKSFTTSTTRILHERDEQK